MKIPLMLKSTLPVLPLVVITSCSNQLQYAPSAVDADLIHTSSASSSKLGNMKSIVDVKQLAASLRELDGSDVLTKEDHLKLLGLKSFNVTHHGQGRGSLVIGDQYFLKLQMDYVSSAYDENKKVEAAGSWLVFSSKLVKLQGKSEQVVSKADFYVE